MTGFRNSRLVDGLDVDAELRALVQLDVFNDQHVQLAEAPPTLQLVRFSRPVQKLGHASRGRVIKLNAGTNVDQYDVKETLVHELTHIYWQRRLPLERVGHDLRFWQKHDRAFREAYDPQLELHVAPRTSRHHGRYARALRTADRVTTADAFLDQVSRDLEAIQAWQDREPDYQNPGYYTDPDVPRELTSQEQAFLEGALPEPYDRPEVIPLPQPLTGMPEPKGSLSQWIDLPVVRAHERQARRDEHPALPSNRRERAAVLDERVFDLVRTYSGRNRNDLDWFYTEEYGEAYPGTSVYNSLWRLQRDRRVYRFGQRWYVNQ